MTKQVATTETTKSAASSPAASSTSPASSASSLVEQLKAKAQDNYDSWGHYVIETMDDAEIQEIIGKVRTLKSAVKRMKAHLAPVMEIQDSHDREARQFSDEEKPAPTKAKKEPKPSKEELLAKGSITGKDGKEYEVQASWFSNASGSQMAGKPAEADDREQKPHGWIGSKIAAAIADQGWSNRQLAIHSGLTIGTVAKFRSGDATKASIASLEKIACSLGLMLV